MTLFHKVSLQHGGTLVHDVTLARCDTLARNFTQHGVNFARCDTFAHTLARSVTFARSFNLTRSKYFIYIFYYVQCLKKIFNIYLTFLEFCLFVLLFRFIFINLFFYMFKNNILIIIMKQRFFLNIFKPSFIFAKLLKL